MMVYKSKGKHGWRCIAGDSSWESLPLTSLKVQGVMTRPGGESWSSGLLVGQRVTADRSQRTSVVQAPPEAGGQGSGHGGASKARSRGGVVEQQGEPLVEKGR